jgi:hypothetical protein
MDPDACWLEALALADRLQNEGSDDVTSRLDDGERLAQLVLSLDEWVKKGGFVPRVFQPKTSLR